MALSGLPTISENPTLYLEKLNFCSFFVAVSLLAALADVSKELVVSPQLLAVGQLASVAFAAVQPVAVVAVMSCNQSRVHFHIQPKQQLFLLDSIPPIQCDQAMNRAEQNV